MEIPDLHSAIIVKNSNLSRFEMYFKGYLSHIDYQINDGIMHLTHTEVAKELAGQGVGSQLIRSSLKMIEKENQRIVPVCPFVLAFIRKNSEFQKLLVPGFQLNEKTGSE